MSEIKRGKYIVYFYYFFVLSNKNTKYQNYFFIELNVFSFNEFIWTTIIKYLRQMMMIALIQTRLTNIS